MSLESKLGFIMMALSAIYLFVVPLVKISEHPLERLHVPTFVIIGLLGLLLFWFGLNKPETKSP